VRPDLRYIGDGLTVGRSQAWAWLRLETTPYEMLSDSQREILAMRHARALASLSDSECHLVVVPRGHSVEQWAKTLDARTMAPSPAWTPYLSSIRDYLGSQALSQREVYLGVRIGEQRRRHQGLLESIVTSPERWLGMEDPTTRERALVLLNSELEAVWRKVATKHVRAYVATASELRWLVRRTQWRGIGDVPVPPGRPGWGGEILALLEGTLHNGHRFVRIEQAEGDSYVATLGFSYFPDRMPFPGSEWLAHYEMFGFPVEASVRFLVVPPRRAARDANRKLAAAIDQARHISQTSAEMPLGLQDAASGARELEYAITKGHEPLLYCWPRLMVAAPSEEELEARVHLVVERYADMGIELVRPTGEQLALFLESTPGDRRRSSSYEQRQSVVTLAGSMYAATVSLGDSEGPYLGFSTGMSRTAVHYDPLLAPQRNRPAAIAGIGEPGGGKTNLAYLLTYQARLRGTMAVMVDPKKEATGLARLPGLGRVQTILLDEGYEGLLDPFRVGEDTAYSSMLAAELCRQFLSPRLSQEVEPALIAAAERTARSPEPSLTRMAALLEDVGTGPAIVQASETLRAIANMPMARICFAGKEIPRLRLEDALTVIQFSQLSLPEAGSDPQFWTIPERLAVGVMFALTALLRSVIDMGTPSQPKLVVLDEAWALTGSSRGRDLVTRLARTGRSKNTALLLLTQNARDLLDERVTNNLSSVFCFRASDPNEIKAMLQLLGVEDDELYTTEFPMLRSGECFFRDLDGRAGRLQVDLVPPALREAFDTTPRPHAPSPTRLAEWAATGTGGE
jgi:hypothetical protein